MRRTPSLSTRPKSAAGPALLILLAALVSSCASSPVASAGADAESEAPQTLAPASGAPSVTAVPTPESPVLAIIKTGTGPNVLAASEDAIWVELHREDVVARIDPASNAQVAVTDVPAHCSITTSWDDGWATIASGSTLTRFALDSGEVLDAISIPDVCGVAAGSDGRVWVTSPGTGDIYEVVAGASEPERSVPVGPMIFELTVLPDAVWVAGEDAGGTVYRVEMATGEVTVTQQLRGVDQVRLLFGALWASARFGNHVWKLDPVTGEILGDATLDTPSGLVEAGGSVWATTQTGDLVEIDPETMEFRSTQPLGYQALAVPILAFGDLWVSALEDNVVLRVDIPD